jgi:hypothetical protein
LAGRGGVTLLAFSKNFDKMSLRNVADFSFKVGSRKVHNYSTKTNFFGIDCSARAYARAPQDKIRFCFRRKIPEFAPITI